MPVTIMDRLPLPNLKLYSAGSVLLLAVAVYHAVGVTNDPAWRANATLARQEAAAAVATEGAMPQPVTPPLDLNATRNLTEQFVDVMTFMMQEPLCMWTVINMCYCSLAVFAFMIQRAVFGSLRVSEAQRIKDKLWNYVFYKFIFVFGVVNVQYMDEVLLWCAWFTLIGFLHLLAQLSKDRFEYLSSSPRVARWAYLRLVVLVCGVVVAGSCMMAVAAAAGVAAGPHTFFFMAAECCLVLLSATHVLARYLLLLYEADVAGPVAYYTHLAFDSVCLGVEAAHVVQQVWAARLLVSAPALVLLLQLRHLLHRLQARWRKHRLYAALHHHMSHTYPMASKEEVEKNQDNCAICWEPMKEARKLPCAHLFHNSCLCQWVQQDASCPTCRRALHASPPVPAPGPAHAPPLLPRALPLAPLAPLAALAGLPPPPPPRNNRLFHFDGSRYVSWLPSFSVEVTRLRAPPPDAAQLDAMARQVQQLFPQYSLSVLIRDLVGTRSAELTVNNILEGRLPAPAPPPPPSPSPAAPAPPAPVAPDYTQAGGAEGAAAAAAGAGREPVAVAEAQTSRADAALPHSLLAHHTHHTASAQQLRPGRFAREAGEREESLQRRKELLIEAARAKYLAKLAARPADPSPAPSHAAPRSS